MSTRTMDLKRVVDRTFGNRKNPMIDALREQALAVESAEPGRPRSDERKRFLRAMQRAVLFIGRARAAS
jgi:hypothetical protein